MDIEGILVLLALWCLIVVLLSDAITYGMVRVVNHQIGSKRTVNYFVAGMFCQPLRAFAFMLDLPIFADDTIKLLPYSQRRAHFSKMADVILEDVAENHYQKVRIFAISVGAIVPYYIGERMAKKRSKDEFELECYLINPCQTAQFLKPKVRRCLLMTYPLMVLLVIILGPLSFVSIIPASGERFSVALAVSQVEQYLFRTSISAGHRQYVKVVMMSRLDEFLENCSIHAFYARRPLKYLDEIKHSDTIGAATAYLKAMEEALANPYSAE